MTIIYMANKKPAKGTAIQSLGVFSNLYDAMQTCAEDVYGSYSSLAAPEPNEIPEILWKAYGNEYVWVDETARYMVTQYEVIPVVTERIGFKLTIVRGDYPE